MSTCFIWPKVPPESAFVLKGSDQTKSDSVIQEFQKFNADHTDMESPSPPKFLKILEKFQNLCEIYFILKPQMIAAN